ncbi:MAG: hypothetical protein HYY23_21630 [Verrucomicrobia bacterium]|nr:hypothetical protein [Verrucomicrobiota bacterium]
MAASENPIAPGPHDTPARAVLDPWQESYRSLRSLLLIVIIGVLILTGSVFVFLLREVSATRHQVKELTQYVAAYEKNSVPVMRQFRDKLIEFVKANPDFAPILSKYVNPTNYANLAPGANSAPARLLDVPAK